MAEGYLSMAPRKRPFLRGCLTVLLVLGAFFALLGIISRMDEIPLGRGERVAVVPISGLIAESEPIIEQLKKFGKDESVKAIVLRIDSPGGGGGPSQEIYEDVKKVRMKKPVLASMGAAVPDGGKRGKIWGEPKVVTPPKKKISFLELLREETRTIIDEKLSGNRLRLEYLAESIRRRHPG